MIKLFFKITVQRVLITLLMHLFQILHYSPSLVELVGHNYCLVMYVIIIVSLSLIEIAILEQKIKPPKKSQQLVLDMIYIIMVLVGLAANLYDYHHVIAATTKDQWLYYIGYVATPAISVCFEAILKVVLSLELISPNTA